MPNRYQMKFVCHFSKALEGVFHLGISFFTQDYSNFFPNNGKRRWINKISHREAYAMILLGKIYLTIGRVIVSDD